MTLGERRDARRQLADPVEAFRARCEACAERYAMGKISLHRAVDYLEASNIELDCDLAQAIITETFAPVREASEPADDDHCGLSRVDRETADHLIRTKNLDELRAWLAVLGERKVAAIRQYMTQKQRATS